MRKLKIKSIGAGPLSGVMIAGLLVFHAGVSFNALALQTKPAPKPVVPVRPVTPAVRPTMPATRPVQPATRPVQPAARPAVPNYPSALPRPGQPGQPVTPRPGTTPRPETSSIPRPGTTPGTGTDRRPIPGGEVRPGPGGNLPHPGTGTGTARGTGPAFHPGPGGVFHGANGTVGKADPRTGRVITMARNEPDGSRTVFHNSPTGVRRVENTRTEFGRPVHTVTDGHRGYVERDLRRQGFHERTYYDRGHVRAVVYQDHVYRRYGAYPVFVPAYYYHPGFYAVFGAGWGGGVSVGYSWASSPGYVAYGGYFAPQPVYTSPNAWMADYIINANLQVDYQAQQDAGADAVAAGDSGQIEQQNATPTPIPQDVRDTYAQQVQTTVSDEQAQASGQQPADDAPGALSPKFRVFQSYSDVEADNGGHECALVGGDFVRREEDAPDANKTVAVTVVTIAVPSASHCAINARVRLAVDTLQDWYNNFLQAQQAGMDAMAANQGQNGFPAMADTGKVANAPGQATPDDPNAVAAAIQQQSASASSMQADAAGGRQ